jgi:adenylate kinase
VFRAIGLDGVVAFRDRSADIAKRLQQRDRESWKVDVIEQHQEAELAHAQFVSRELSVPFKVLSAFDFNGLANAIANWT